MGPASLGIEALELAAAGGACAAPAAGFDLSLNNHLAQSTQCSLAIAFSGALAVAGEVEQAGGGHFFSSGEFQALDGGG